MSVAQDNRQVEMYLFFNSKCEPALEFYRKALGAEVEMIMRYRESPEPRQPGSLPPGFEDKVMHASFRVGHTLVMASDGCSAEPQKFQGFSLALSVPNEPEAGRVFTALSEGGHLLVPLRKTFWSPCFGMVEDRFGVTWIVSVRPAEQKGA